MGEIWVFQCLVRIVIWYVPSHSSKCDRGKIDKSTIHRLSFSKIFAYLAMDEQADWSVTIGFIMPNLSTSFASWFESWRFFRFVKYILKFLIVIHFLTKLKLILKLIDIDRVLRRSWGWFSSRVSRQRRVIIVDNFNFFWMSNRWWSRSTILGGVIFFYIG